MAETFKKSRDNFFYPYFATAIKSMQFKVYMIYSFHVGCKDDQEMNHRRKMRKIWKNIIFRLFTLLNDLETFEYFVRYAVFLYLLNQ